MSGDRPERRDGRRDCKKTHGFVEAKGESRKLLAFVDANVPGWTDIGQFIFDFIVVVILGGNADAGPSNEIRVVGDESIDHKLLQRVSITTSLTAAVH